MGPGRLNKLEKNLCEVAILEFVVHGVFCFGSSFSRSHLRIEKSADKFSEKIGYPEENSNGNDQDSHQAVE